MLSHVRVLDLTDDRGNFAGLILAQLGADVVLVEPPGGSAGRRDDRWHLAYNRGKRSVVIDGPDALARLAAGADIILDCGALAPLGIDRAALDALREANPQLVTVSITAYGDDGPKAGWPATDLTIAAAGGQLSLTGDQDRPPVRISVPQSWLQGAAEAVNGALIALHERTVSGRGQHVSVSCQQAMLQCTQMSMLASLVGAPLYQRCAGGILIGPYRVQFVYPARDGHVSITFLFGQMIGPFTQRLMDWVHEEGHCSAELRDLDWVDFFNLLFSGRLEPGVLAEAVAAVGALTATKTKAELVAGAKERRLLLAAVATTADVVESEQLAARDYWDLVDGVRVPGPFAKASRTPLRRLGAPPAPGSTTVEELASERPAPPTTSPAAPTIPSGTAPTRRPLEGVKVLDLTWAIAGPMCTRVLADWGATIVRVESERRPDIIRNAGPFLAGTPGGIEDTAQWHNPNAGKLSVTLNLSTPEGRDVIRDLVRWADVVVESFTPKAMRNWDLGYEQLAELNPSIIMLSTCLMGQTGPDRDFAGFGNLAGAVAGFYDLTGWADRPPAGPFLAYTDYTSPRLSLSVLLAALEHRRRTGEGQYLDFSQAEAALHFLSPALLAYSRDGVVLTRRGNDDDVLSPHGVYPCAGENRWIAIACDHTGRDVLAGMVGVGPAALDDDTLAAWTAPQPAEQLQQRLVAAGIAAHQVQNAEECAADPQLAHRQHFRNVAHPLHGSTWVEGPHFLLSRSPGGPAWAGPTMGQHNEEVLNGILGYDADRVADLVIADAIA
ncbi:MAG: CoA transferase [Acidimicrobiia bacterium]